MVKANQFQFGLLLVLVGIAGALAWWVAKTLPEDWQERPLLTIRVEHCGYIEERR